MTLFSPRTEKFIQDYYDKKYKETHMNTTPRQQAYDQLAQLATDLELSYTVEGDEFTVTLPPADKQTLDIITKIEVPLDQEEMDITATYKILAYNVEANLDETVKNYVAQGWTTYGDKVQRDGRFCQVIVKEGN